MRSALAFFVPLVLNAVPVLAQDPVKVAPTTYTVVLENDQVRVLRAVVAPGTKTAMHEHPANVVIPLTDATVKFTLPDGSTQNATLKSGTPIWGPSGKHAGENPGTTKGEVIIVELKRKS